MLALVDFAFHSAFALYEVYGVLYVFQAILSAWWLAISGFVITWGILHELKAFRVFGLVLLVGSVLKSCLAEPAGAAISGGA